MGIIIRLAASWLVRLYEFAISTFSNIENRNAPMKLPLFVLILNLEICIINPVFFPISLSSFLSKFFVNVMNIFVEKLFCKRILYSGHWN